MKNNLRRLPLFLTLLTLLFCFGGCAGQADHAPFVPYTAVPDMGVELPGSNGDESVDAVKQALTCAEPPGTLPADLYFHFMHNLGIYAVSSNNGCPLSMFSGEPFDWQIGQSDTDYAHGGAAPIRHPQPALSCQWINNGTFSANGCFWDQSFRCNYGDLSHQITYHTQVSADAGGFVPDSFINTHIWISATGNALLNAQGQPCTRIITATFNQE